MRFVDGNDNVNVNDDALSVFPDVDRREGTLYRTVDCERLLTGRLFIILFAKIHIAAQVLLTQPLLGGCVENEF